MIVLFKSFSTPRSQYWSDIEPLSANDSSMAAPGRWKKFVSCIQNNEFWKEKFFNSHLYRIFKKFQIWLKTSKMSFKNSGPLLNRKTGFFLMISDWIEKLPEILKMYIKSRLNKSHRAIRWRRIRRWYQIFDTSTHFR